MHDDWMRRCGRLIEAASMQLLREVLMEREPPLLLLDVACPLCPLHGPAA